MNNQHTRPEPLRMDNEFAYKSMAERVPHIIRETQAANADYPPAILHALDRLHAALTGNAPVTMLDTLPVPADDYAGWEAAYRSQQAKAEPLTWLHAEWFFAETLCYRHLIQAVRWHETGRDPFAPKKQVEFESDNLWQLLHAALDVDADFDEALSVLLSYSLWGNRVDLSHPAGSLAGETASDDDLLVDDRAQLQDYLTSTASDESRAHSLHIVADNAGTELAMDLALADLWLSRVSQTVVLHLKSHPTFVSDATIPDLWHTLRALTDHGGQPAALAQRLHRAWQAGRLTLAAHSFWNSSYFLWEMPPLLQQALAHARLVILKGDANYRRATGDAIWEAGTPFPDAVDYFPAPILALRSLKSDTLVGVPDAITRRLDASSDTWRTTGQYGVMQFAR